MPLPGIKQVCLELTRDSEGNQESSEVIVERWVKDLQSNQIDFGLSDCLHFPRPFSVVIVFFGRKCYFSDFAVCNLFVVILS